MDSGAKCALNAICGKLHIVQLINVRMGARNTVARIVGARGFVSTKRCVPFAKIAEGQVYANMADNGAYAKSAEARRSVLTEKRGPNAYHVVEQKFASIKECDIHAKSVKAKVFVNMVGNGFFVKTVRVPVYVFIIEIVADAGLAEEPVYASTRLIDINARSAVRKAISRL